MKRSGLNYEVRRDSETGYHLVGVGIVFFVIMNCPPICHDDGVLGEEVAVIPIILDQIMVVAELVDWSPSEDFLDDCPHVWEIGFIIKVGGSIRSNDTI
jgi:hypothetical protein